MSVFTSQPDPEHLARALDIVRTGFPGATAAFLGGSAGSGRARPTSDLDIVVVLDTPWDEVSFVETSTTPPHAVIGENGARLVETFVYGRGGLARWLAKGRTDWRPVVDRLIAEGAPLLGTKLEHELADASRATIHAGPAPLDDQERDLRRYALSALVDDLQDVIDDHDAASVAVVAGAAWRAGAELSLLLERRWLGTGKWLVRELRRTTDQFGLLAWVESPASEAARLVPALQAVLEDAGGWLQAGMLRGERPASL